MYIDHPLKTENFNADKFLKYNLNTVNNIYAKLLDSVKDQSIDTEELAILCTSAIYSEIEINSIKIPITLEENLENHKYFEDLFVILCEYFNFLGLEKRGLIDISSSGKIKLSELGKQLKNSLE